MSSSESYQDENIFLSADEEENQSQHFNIDEEEIEEISASFSGLQPYQLEPGRVVITGSENDKSSEEGQSGSEQGEEVRAGDTAWCQCDKCHREEREIDSLCCQESCGN